MKQFALCLLCVVLGWFLGLRYTSSCSDSESPLSEQEATEVELAEQKTLVANLREKISKQEAELALLESELSDAHLYVNELQASSPADPAGESEPANPFVENMQTMAVGMLQIHNQEELEKLKRLLNLSPDQYAAIEAFHQQQAEEQAHMMEQIFAGTPPEEIDYEYTEDEANRTYFTLDELLDDILSADQLEAYEAHEEQAALEHKEAMAYSQLSSLQRQFVLDEDQKDAAFAIFYESDYQIQHDEWDSLEIDSSDPEFGIKLQELSNERLLEALSEVLTEEQLESHRVKLDAELEMQRKAMQMFGEGGL